MQNKALNIINEIKKILEETYSDFKGIYFFGSQSKNVNPIESDYDLALIFSRKIDRKFKNEIIHIGAKPRNPINEGALTLLYAMDNIIQIYNQ